jgi:WD40 repeat protein
MVTITYRPVVLLCLLACTILVPCVFVRAEPPAAAPILCLETGNHLGPIYGLAVDANGKYVVTSGEDKTVRVWQIRGDFSDPPSEDQGDAAKLVPVGVLRPPIGDGLEGRLAVVAISPDGATVACSGQTGFQWDASFSVYIFDRATGRMIHRLTGFNNTVNNLHFSPDGKYLAFGGTFGIHAYRTSDWALVGADDTGGEYCIASAFAPQTAGGPIRIATTGCDGFVRLCSVTSNGLAVVAKKKAPGGSAAGLAFSPDGSRLLVGYDDAVRVDVLSGTDLSTMLTPSTAGLRQVSLFNVCWSKDGKYIFAGPAWTDGHNNLRRWNVSSDDYADLDTGAHRVTNVVTLPHGGIAYVTDPAAIGVWCEDRKYVLSSAAPDLRHAQDELRLGASPGSVSFGYNNAGDDPASFSLAARAVTLGSAPDSFSPAVTSAPGLDIQNWKASNSRPTLNGQPLKIGDGQPAHAVAIAPDHQSLVIGAGALCCFGADGKLKWAAETPMAVWAVNVTADGKLAVAALGDGTIRWYRMSDGKELLALFPDADKKQWIAWTPSGYYDCSAGSDHLLGFHFNNGKDQAADFVPVSKFRDQLNRPDIVAKILMTLDEAQAVKQADAGAGHPYRPLAIVDR